MSSLTNSMMVGRSQPNKTLEVSLVLRFFVSFNRFMRCCLSDHSPLPRPPQLVVRYVKKNHSNSQLKKSKKYKKENGAILTSVHLYKKRRKNGKKRNRDQRSQVLILGHFKARKRLKSRPTPFHFKLIAYIESAFYGKIHRKAL